MSKTTKDPITIVEGKKFRECMKCHKQGMRWAFKYHIHDETRNNFYVNYDGPFWCSECGEDFCDECGSHNLQAYDDGEGYPPNIKCKDCGHWPQ